MIPRFKIGICNCPECNGRETEGRKVGKNFSCMASYRKEKARQYTANANQRNKARGLVKKQVANGNYFEAERQVLINDIDFVFSRIVRLRETDLYGNCSCYTCSYTNNWSKLQCGHFVDRGNMKLRFDFRNSRPQCPKCNCELDGNLKVYAEKLNEEQSGLPDTLIEESREPYHWTREELKQTLIAYRNILNNLEIKLKNNQQNK